MPADQPLTRIERWAPLIIWVYFVSQAVSAGFMIPHWDLPVMKATGASWVFGLAGAFLFSCFSVASGILQPRGDATFLNRIGRRLNFEWLAVMFFVGGGGFATFQCLRLGSPFMNLWFSLFMLCFGLGTLSGYAVFLLRNRWRAGA